MESNFSDRNGFTVSRRIPDYLRLHTETENETREAQREQHLSWPDLVTLVAEAVGCSVSTLEKAVRRDSARDPKSEEDTQPLSAMMHALRQLWSERDRSARMLRSSEAELATAIPVISRPSERWTEHLESLLRGAAQVTLSDAAALFLLDDATTQLKLRSSWGLDSARLSEPARPLRDAIADLEALTGHAVVLEDTRSMRHWNPPFDFASAACVPLRSASMSLGTLWVFREELLDYTDHDTHVLEMVAEGLTSELERQVLLREAGRRDDSAESERGAAVWIPPELDGWDIAGSSVDPIPRAFCFWHMRFDGAMCLAVGQGQQGNAGLEPVRLLLRSLADMYGDPEELLTHMNQAIWSESSGASQPCGSWRRDVATRYGQRSVRQSWRSIRRIHVRSILGNMVAVATLSRNADGVASSPPIRPHCPPEMCWPSFSRESVPNWRPTPRLPWRNCWSNTVRNRHSHWRIGLPVRRSEACFRRVY